MINDGINDNKYATSNDTTLNDSHNFQQFIYRNFKDHKCYKELRPTSNHQPDYSLLLKRINLNPLEI